MSDEDAGARPPASEADDERPARHGSTPKPTRRRSRRRRLVAALGVIVVAVGIWTAVCGLVAASRLRAVRADISRISSNPGDDRGALEQRLATDLASVRSARKLLGQVGPRVVAALPLLGRNVTAEQHVTRASEAAIGAGLTVLRSTENLGDGNGGVDLSRLSQAQTSLASAAADLRDPLHGLAETRTGWTLPPVQTGVRDARDELLGLDTTLQRGADALGAVAGVLGADGRRTVLVGLMNNAELRGSGGLLSAYAVGHSIDGKLELSGFRDVNEVAESSGFARRVAAPADYVAAYGPYLANSTLWKNVTMSPQAGESAEVLSKVAALSLHVHPDVVILADVPAASAIVTATGPVTIDGEQISGDELTKRLLVDAYGEGSLSKSKQHARRLALTSAASQAFSRLRARATATPALLQALADTAAGRHLVVWSAVPQEQRQLVAAGVGGVVDATGADIAMPVLNNLGDSPGLGNKLDYYVSRSMQVTAKVDPDTAQVVQTLTLHNNAPTGLGPYVGGLRHPGEVRELLSLDVARGARLTSFTRDDQPVDVSQSLADGAQRLTTVMTLSRGSTTTFRLAYSLPIHGAYRLLAVPQPLAAPAALTVRVTADGGSSLGVVTGGDQPRDGVVSVSGDWTTVHDLRVPVSPLHGLSGLVHSIANFWTHKVQV